MIVFNPTPGHAIMRHTSQYVWKRKQEYEKTDPTAAAGGGQHAVRPVLRGGQSDLSGFHGPTGGAQPLAGRGRVSRHRRGTAPAGGGGAGHQPGGRAAGAEQPGEPGLRPLLHLSSLPDHRALLRHSPLRHRLLHGGHPADAPRNRPDAGAGGLLAGVLCSGPLFLAAPRRDPHLGGQGAQPAVPGLPGGAGAAGADGASRGGVRH